jgi:hypothetical protein
LFPSSSDAASAWNMQGQNVVDWNVKKSLHCFLLLRRLRAELSNQTPENLLKTSDEEFPLQSDGEDDKENTVIEGAAIDLQNKERIVCSVVTAEGKTTRYFILDDHLLMLCAPDDAQPGWGVVKTTTPLRQLESHVDRSDPRTLLMVQEKL